MRPPCPTATTRLLYSGSQIIAEMNTSGAVQRRYVPGAAMDEPLVWYLDSGTSNKRWLLTDNQGSITSWTVANGTVSYVNTYDEFGQPAASNTGLIRIPARCGWRRSGSITTRRAPITRAWAAS